MENDTPIQPKIEFQTEISDFEKIIEAIMAGKKGLSYSALSAFLESPKHFYEYKTGVKETTPAMLEGKQFHMACLEPEKFEETYWVLDDTEKVDDLLTNGYLDSKGKLVIPTSPRSTKPYKEWVIEQDKLNVGRERISKELFDTFINMSKALNKNKSSGYLMKILNEHESDFEEIIDGFLFKGKIDGKGEITKDNFKENNLDLYEGDKVVIDLKKVADAKYEKIKWDIRKKNYHLQGGLYSNVSRASKYFLVYIDKGCNILVVQLEPSILEEGYIRLETTLAEFTRCAEEDAWGSSYEFFNGGYIKYS